MDANDLIATRRSLHGIAELVIAGPQYQRLGSIELRVRPGGFGGAVSDVRVDGRSGIPTLVSGSTRVPLVGSCRSLAAAVGDEVSGLGEVYADGSGVDPDEPLVLDPEAVALLLDWFVRGNSGLRTFAPDEEPVLWPEHFDVGFALDEVNYGVSPGDASLSEPYAYVGPWTPRTGDFWNVSFGAARPASALAAAADVAAFFAAGLAAAERPVPS